MMFPAMKQGTNLANDVVDRALTMLDGFEKPLNRVWAEIELETGQSVL